METTPLDRALARVGDRWTLLVVDALLEGPRRYGELSAAVSGIAPNILAARLRKLEQEGLVVSTPYSSRPLRHQYQLTADGRELAGALQVLATGRRGSMRCPAPAATTTPAGRRSSCGLVPTCACPTCATTRRSTEADADDLDRF